MLENLKNYYMYASFIKNGDTVIPIYVPDINVNNIDDHINGIYAILKDAVETDYIHHLIFNLTWQDMQCELYIVDYWYSLFMWKILLKVDTKIRPIHIFYQKELKRSSIKSFIDNFVLTKENRIKYGNNYLNVVISDGLWQFSYIESFAGYLANTINNEDDILLMNSCPEYYQLMHTDFTNVPIQDVKDYGMGVTNRVIDIIKNDSKKYIGYEHGLANSFRASEAINPRQFKEARINIGTKPNGTGGIYPYIINKNFANGGVNDPLSFFIESNSARTAQILSKNNVGTSGDFARILGLNNTDTILNRDMQYECMSFHYVKYIIKSDKHLNMIKNRYFRFNPNGVDYIINANDTSLIGKTVYLHSPMTCASHSAGNGICKRCYGDLYYTNYNINPGKIAAEILSSQLTQTLLSAKHLLETMIQKIKWNEEFGQYFEININEIKLNSDLENVDLKKYHMIIDPELIYAINDEDTIYYDDDNDDNIIDGNSIIFNEYIQSFTIKTPTEEMITMQSEDQDSLFISKELNKVIRDKAEADESGMLSIPLQYIFNKDIPLFYIKINNNEISKTIDNIIDVINKSSVTENFKTLGDALQRIVDLVIDAHLNIDSVHLEVILSNQISAYPKDSDYNITKPNWNDPNAVYYIYALNTALIKNGSVVISLLYKDLAKTLYNPLTYKKNKPSFFDLFFNIQPQLYLDPDTVDYEETSIKKPVTGIKLVEDITPDEKKGVKKNEQ